MEAHRGPEVFTCPEPDGPAASAWSAAPGPMSRWTVGNTEGETDVETRLR